MYLPIDPVLHTAPLDREMIAAATEKFGYFVGKNGICAFPPDTDPDDVSIPPEPYDRRPVMTIRTEAYQAMVTHLSNHEPEVAGALLADVGDQVVKRFIADEWGRSSAASFTFGSTELNRVIRPHVENGEEVVGIVHSHPSGYTQLSCGDELYFRGLFANPKNAALREFFCPIFVDGTLLVFLARRMETTGEIRFLPGRLEVLPSAVPAKKRDPVRSLDTTRIRKLIDVVRMKERTVTIVGAGGGANLARNLVRCNLGRIKLVDFDRIEAVNICRQEHPADAVGLLKIESLAEELHRINPGVTIECFPHDFCTFGDQEIDESFGDTDLLIFAVDNLDANARGNEVALRLGTPALWSGLYAGGKGGEVAFWKPDLPCYRCLCGKRYAARDRGEDVGQPAESADIFAVQYLDSVAGMIAVGLLTAGADNAYGRLIDQLGDRNFIQLKISPDWTFAGRDIFREHLGVDADCPAYFNWLSIARRDPTGGRSPP